MCKGIFFKCKFYEIKYRSGPSNGNLASELRCVVDFKDLFKKENVKYLINSFKMLITC